ncbi:MAG: HPF/RaiA family ribosome-associated protein [Bacteriovoracaceae bacterium]|nr:HPF/RaiA family ribosome-associated protein [Bacteriovoracaceae bacterium]
MEYSKNFRINAVKEHIHRIYPEAKKIDVQVRRSPKGDFSAQIKVSSPSHFLLAKKSDESYGHSLERAFDAISKQIARVKNKRTKNYRPYDWNELVAS